MGERRRAAAQSRQLAIVREPRGDRHLGLGSNVGDRRRILQAAVDCCRSMASVLASSSVYDTEPVGEVLDQPEFLNAGLRIETDLEPEGCSTRARRSSGRWGASARAASGTARGRSTSTCCCSGRGVRVRAAGAPAREVPGRRFVLVPLLELDPDVAMPAGRRAADAVPDDAEVRRSGPPLQV